MSWYSTARGAPRRTGGPYRRRRSSSDQFNLLATLSVSHTPRMIDGGDTRFLSPIEAAVDYERWLASARRACGEKLARMLEWIAVESMGWRAQALAWWADARERAARVAFKRQLRLCRSALEAHYRRR